MFQLRRRPPEIALDVRPLTPSYSEEEHAVVVETLVKSMPRGASSRYKVRNIAVAGPYGSGKSSVLMELQRRLGSRAIDVSLSSLTAGDPELDRKADEEGLALPTTNFVQKEIVKQILYRERFGALPDSRFERIHPPSVLATLAVALTTLAAWFGLAVFFDIPKAWASLFTMGNEHGAWGMVSSIGVAVSATSTLVYALIRRRVQVASVSAGPASISLSSRQDYYFDRYLDEIVYFFRVSRTGVVIFEDIDRFRDVHVFESLRNLNVLLNNSRELKQPVYFVYAVRDSIFLDVHRSSRNVVDGTGSRTKFFDLIVPLVPFITHRNARDLLRIEMRDVKPAVSTELIDLVASNLTDMRLLRNIRNEYLAFASSLLDASRNTKTMPGLKPDHLFAMMVMKNLAPRQFEKIRTRLSELDRFFDDVARLRSEELSLLRVRRAEIINSPALLENVVESMGPKLTAILRALEAGYSSVYSGSRIDRISVGPKTFEKPDGSDAELLVAILEHRNADVFFTNGRSATIESALIDVTFGPDGEYTSVRRDAELLQRDEQDRLERKYAHIRSSSVSKLLADDTLVFADGSTLGQVLNSALRKSPKVLSDLIRIGAIDHHYALYAARYYGEALTPDGMTFILQHAEPNMPNYDFTFENEAAIDAVLGELGEGFFDDAASFNFEIVAHLEARRNAPFLRRLADRLSQADRDGVLFLSSLLRTDDGGLLLSEVSARWAGSMHFVSGLEGVTAQRKAELLRIVLQSMGDGQTASDAIDSKGDWRSDVRRALDEHQFDLDDALKRLDGRQAERVANLFSDVGWRHPDLRLVSEELSSRLLGSDGFELNSSNLAYLGDVHPGEVPSLDRLSSQAPAVYESACRRIDEYLDALGRGGGYSVDKRNRLVAIVTDVATYSVQSLGRLLDAARPGLRVETVGTVPPELWETLMTHGRVENTVENALVYLERFGPDPDDAIAANWRSQLYFSEVSAGPTADEIAAAVANAATVPADDKMLLIGSLGDVSIAESELKAESANVLGELINVGLVPDSLLMLQRAIEFGSDAWRDIVADSLAFAGHIRAIPGLSAYQFLEAFAAPRATAANLLSLIEMLPVWELEDSRVFNVAASWLLRNQGARPSLRFLEWVARRQAVPASVVLELLTRDLGAPVGASPWVGVDEVHAVLVALGGPFADLTSPRSASVVFREDRPTEALLAFLREDGEVTSWRVDGDSLRVFLRRT